MPSYIFFDRIIAFKDDGQYSAVSLEFDLAAAGHTMEEAMEMLKDATLGYLRVCVEDKMEQDKIYRPAPKKYQDMWKAFEQLKKAFKKQVKGTLKKEDRAIIKNETKTICQTYDSKRLVNA